MQPKMLTGSSILMTGGTGPFGQAIVDYIDRNIPGTTVVLVTRDVDSSRKKFKEYNNVDISYCRFDLSSCDATSYLDLPVCEYVIHMASVTASESYNQIDPLVKYRLLATGTELIADYCKHNKVKKVLFTSSGAVYGENTSLGRMHEEDACQVLVDKPATYSLLLGKLAAEFTISCLKEYSDTDACICRCFGICGPWLPVDLHYALGNFVYSALRQEEIVINSDGLSLRSYIDTRDLAEWILCLLTSNTRHLIYNVGSDESISIKDLAENVKRITCSTSSIRVRGSELSRLSNPNVKSFVPSIDRAKSEGLGLRYGLEESVKYYAEWVRRHYN